MDIYLCSGYTVGFYLSSNLWYYQFGTYHSFNGIAYTNVALIIAEGAKATPSDIMEMANSFSTTNWQKVTDIFLPHLIPYLIASARVAFGIGVKVVIVAEVVGLTTGIGFMVKYWYDQVFLAPLIAWGIVLVCLALLFEYAFFDILERKLTKWRTTGEQTFQNRGE